MQTAPEILEYKSIKKYFTDYYHFRNAQDGHFSYEVWSSELEYKSRSFLPMIIAGQRNISEEFVENFSKKMNFDTEQTRHFKVLTLLHQNSRPEMASIYEDGLFKTLNINKKRFVVEEEGFSSFILNPLVRLVISFKDFKATLNNMKNLLGVTEDRLKIALTHLTRLNLIQPSDTDETVWESSSQSLEVKSTNTGLKKFHRDTQQEVLEQLETDHESKKFRSIYFSVNPDRINDMSEDIENFLKKLRAKYSENHLRQNQIVKVNVQAYPLTEILSK